MPYPSFISFHNAGVRVSRSYIAHNDYLTLSSHRFGFNCVRADTKACCFDEGVVESVDVTTKRQPNGLPVET